MLPNIVKELGLPVIPCYSTYIELQSIGGLYVQKEMIKGYIDAIVLSILSQSDAYGYEITKIVNKKTSGLFELKEGTLYPALKRLEANQFIEGYWADHFDGRPRRRYYRITQDGHKKLEESKNSWQKNVNIINSFLGGVFSGTSANALKPNP